MPFIVRTEPAGGGPSSARNDEEAYSGCTPTRRDEVDATAIRPRDDGSGNEGHPSVSETAIVSACLLGFPCRHDGRDKRNQETLREIEARGLAVVPICPEVAGGLPILREASFVEGERVLERTSGRDVTASFQRGAEAALRATQEFHASFAVLKQNSPSCGTRMTGGREGRIAGEGVTAKRLREAGVAVRGEDSPW